MKKAFLIIFVLIFFIGHAQNELEWSQDYELTFLDFQSGASIVENGTIYSLHSGISLMFAYQMSNAEFMFKKNFNPAVRVVFNPLAASLVAPDSAIAESLINFARFEFDLTELYARKLRLKLFEEKGTFSNSDFYQPIYEKIHAELNVRNTNAGKETDLGRDSQKLKLLHQEVQTELDELADYCFTCKPPKKKKKKKS